ncbi:MAG: class I SAM-dependent methyltransferase [Candidatus Limnocylindrales bacterium]
MTSIFGDPRRVTRAIRGFPPYVRNLAAYARTQGTVAPDLRLDQHYLYPCLTDRYDEGGTASGHYFHQDIWAARHIHDAAPSEHYDIGSRIDGFIGHLLAFREVTVIDIRPVRSSQPGLHFLQASVLDLPLASETVASLSCLHAMEHVGLGRYGDPIDPGAYLVGMRELARVLAPGGRLYFSVPIGRQRLEFDAHRVFDPRTIVDAFADLRLVEFSAVDDRGDFKEHAAMDTFRTAWYSCGLFVFERPSSAKS